VEVNVLKNCLVRTTLSRPSGLLPGRVTPS